jgi:transporter family-2 protein
MQKEIIVPLVIALVSGIAIGIQGTLNNWAGKLVGPIQTGLYVNFFGGVIAVIISFIFFKHFSGQWNRMSGNALLILIISGGLGICIITGIAFALPRIGIAAGLSSIIFGQMMVAVIVDTLGWGGMEPIPIKLSRLLGLILLFVGIVLLLPS